MAKKTLDISLLILKPHYCNMAGFCLTKQDRAKNECSFSVDGICTNPQSTIGYILSTHTTSPILGDLVDL